MFSSGNAVLYTLSIIVVAVIVVAVAIFVSGGSEVQANSQLTGSAEYKCISLLAIPQRLATFRTDECDSFPHPASSLPPRKPRTDAYFLQQSNCRRLKRVGLNNAHRE